VRRATRILIAVSAAATLAGCPSPRAGADTTDVDRHRAGVLRADPVFAGAPRPPTVYVGKVLSEDLGWDRSRVLGTLYVRESSDPPPVPTPAEFETRLSRVLRTLRHEGWNVLWASCEPPGQPTGGPGDLWQWEASGFRVTGGVGYWFGLRGHTERDGASSIDLALHAPNHRDPANPFADNPVSMREDATCIERPGVSDGPERDGTRIELTSRRALPKAHPETDPSAR
jgi:hypothetical protein